MSATYKTRQVGDVAVVDLEGKLRLGSITLLRKIVEKQLRIKNVKILLHLKSVNQIDEAAIRELGALATLVHGSGGQLKLVHVGQVRGFSVVSMAKFDCNYPDEPAAIRSFP